MAKNNTHTPTVVSVLAVLVALMAMSDWVRGTDAACPTVDLDPCLPAAEADVTPTTECCSNLSTYVTSTNDVGNDLVCLCEAAMGTAFFSANSADYAILIPQKCNLSYDAGTQCDGVTIPGGQ